MKRIKTVLLGLGAVNIGLIKILNAKRKNISDSYHLELMIIAVADSSGFAIKNTGFEYEELIALKAAGHKVRDLDGYISNTPVDDIVARVDAELLVDGSPVNLKSGKPGLQAIRDALEKSWSVVSANKAPLVLAYDELHALANQYGGGLAYSATVCGGLPVINVLQRDMRATNLISLKGIFNATSNFILEELEKGNSFDEAVKEAQRIGAAEADPSLDIDGYDTANKLYIILKSFCDFSGKVSDIFVEGVRGIDTECIERASRQKKKIKLLATAEKSNDEWHLAVKPVELDEDTFLGGCHGWEMGIEFQTDYYEEIAMKIREKDPMATSAAVLRDIINIYYHL